MDGGFLVIAEAIIELITDRFGPLAGWVTAATMIALPAAAFLGIVALFAR